MGKKRLDRTSPLPAEYSIFHAKLPELAAGKNPELTAREQTWIAAFYVAFHHTKRKYPSLTIDDSFAESFRALENCHDYVKGNDYAYIVRSCTRANAKWQKRIKPKIEAQSIEPMRSDDDEKRDDAMAVESDQKQRDFWRDFAVRLEKLRCADPDLYQVAQLIVERKKKGFLDGEIADELGESVMYVRRKLLALNEIMEPLKDYFG